MASRAGRRKNEQRRSAGREEQHDASGNEQGGRASERASSKGTKEQNSGASRSKDYELREASSRMITDLLHPLRSTRSSIINHYIPLRFKAGVLSKDFVSDYKLRRSAWWMKLAGGGGWGRWIDGCWSRELTKASAYFLFIHESRPGSHAPHLSIHPFHVRRRTCQRRFLFAEYSQKAILKKLKC